MKQAGGVTLLIDDLRPSRTHQLVPQQSSEHGGKMTTAARLMTAACCHVVVRMQMRCVAAMQPVDSL